MLTDGVGVVERGRDGARGLGDVVDGGTAAVGTVPVERDAQDAAPAGVHHGEIVQFESVRGHDGLEHGYQR